MGRAQPWAGRATGGPQAELWFGVHPGGPSPLVDTAGEPTGELLADHFDIAAIPLLVKLLAAARPLAMVRAAPDWPRATPGWRVAGLGAARDENPRHTSQQR